MSKKIIFVLTGTILWLLFSVPVMARTFPIIVKWENGNGYDETGKKLEDTWAYDSVHETGKYVLFGEEGEVIKKSETWENRNQVKENFTVTNQDTGTLAIRVEVFSGFTGTVEGSVKEHSGIEYPIELNKTNQYSVNLELVPGEYQLSVNAVEEDRLYEIRYDKEKFHMKEAEVRLENLQVMEECIGKVKEVKAGKEMENDSVSTTLQAEELKTDPVSKEMLKIIGKFAIPVLLIVFIGYLLVCKKKKTYT